MGMKIDHQNKNWSELVLWSVVLHFGCIGKTHLIASIVP